VKFDVNAVLGCIVLDPEFYDKEFRKVGSTIVQLFSEARRAHRRQFDEEMCQLEDLLITGVALALGAAAAERL
jgi:hypothetical protein